MDNVSHYFSSLGLKNKKDDKEENPKPPYPGTLAPLRRKLKTDEYMSRVDVEDHIVPIWERETEVSEEKEEAEDVTLSYSYSLLSFVSRSIEGTVSSYESDHFDLLTESDIEENEVRGVYLHELQRMTNTDIPGPDAYPVYIKGLPISGNLVECIDASPYAQQFPVILYEWFIGTEYNSMERYFPEPVSTGKTFTIPIESIGKFIFCRAHRVVEPQFKTPENWSKTGTYDPHIWVFNNSYPNQKKFHNISSLCSSGPVDISDDLALKLLENLSEGYSEECSLSYNKDFSSSVTHNTSTLMGRSLDLTLHIGSNLSLSISTEEVDRHTLFSQEFFSRNLKEDPDSSEKMSLELLPEDILVQESNQDKTELLFGIYEDKKVKYYFLLKLKDRIQCLVVLYTIRCFLAQQKLGFGQEVWVEALKNGDLDRVVKIIRDYLSSL